MQRSKEIAKVWLDKSSDDIRWAEDSFKTGHFSGTCFLSQQIAEKTLKAYLFFKGEKLVRTHNLFRLLRRCKVFDPALERFGATAKVLNIYYTDTRYPDIWDISRFEDKNLAEEALKLTKEVYAFVKVKINQ